MESLNMGLQIAIKSYSPHIEVLRVEQKRATGAWNWRSFAVPSKAGSFQDFFMIYEEAAAPPV